MNQTNVLPLVLIKDPYHWIISQCRHKYMTNWDHDAVHSTNILSHRTGKPTEMTVKYAKDLRRCDTLVGMWNGWYAEYLDQISKYPLVYIHFEDLMFHTEKTVTVREGYDYEGSFDTRRRVPRTKVFMRVRTDWYRLFFIMIIRRRDWRVGGRPSGSTRGITWINL